MNKNFKLVIEYDGTLFFGWQRQNDKRTIQGELESALSKILNQKIQIRGSGRTDAGVHALGQVAHFHATTQMDPKILKKGLNSLIKPSIVIRECSLVEDTFHAQYNAKSKEYNYYILNRTDPCAIGSDYFWHVKKPLDLILMNQCCDLITGVHDFKSFENTGSPRNSSIRQVYFATVEPLKTEPLKVEPLKVEPLKISQSLENTFLSEGTYLVFKISASGFLRQMVRNIMGTLVDVGLKKVSPQEFETILKAGDRSLASRTAPAKGLFLKRVNYPLN
jgi:tRNA pseudouridine38-40 synthase